MKKFFNPEGFLWKPLGWIGEIVMLSLLWVVFSMGIVTVGPATAALYDTVVHVMRRRETDLFPRFLQTFRAEFKTGCLSALLWLVPAALLALLWRALSGMEDARFGLAAGVYGPVLLFLLVLCAGWVFPLLSRFTFGFADLNRTALRLALGNILRSAVLALLILLGAAVIWVFTFPFLFVPGLVALLCSFLIEPVFARYEQQ